MEKIYAKSQALRALNEKTIYVKSVFFPYYTGYVESENKFRTFIRFPIIADEYISQGDERAKPKTPGEKMEFREKVWVDGKVAFKKFDGKVDSNFFKTFKKTFDVALESSEPISVEVWDKDAKMNVSVETDNLVVPFGASKIKKALEDLELDSEVQLVPGKDKLGNPSSVMPYDYEDAIRGELVGKFIRVKVKGNGIDTRYTFKEGEAFEISEEAQSQALKGAVAANGNGNFRAMEEQIDLEDIPF